MMPIWFLRLSQKQLCSLRLHLLKYSLDSLLLKTFPLGTWPPSCEKPSPSHMQPMGRCSSQQLQLSPAFKSSQVSDLYVKNSPDDASRASHLAEGPYFVGAQIHHSGCALSKFLTTESATKLLIYTSKFYYVTVFLRSSRIIHIGLRPHGQTP